MTDILNDLLSTSSYTVLGLVLFALGFVMVDLLTPGKLPQQVVAGHRPASALLAAALFSTGIVIAAAIYQADGALGEGLISAGTSALVGLFGQAIGFTILDKVTPGKLAELMFADAQTTHPITWVVCASQLGLGLIIASALI